MPSSRPCVGIVIPCWNHEEHTLRCLAALDALDYPNYRLIVVDNGSTELSFRALERQAAGAKLIRLPANLGFSGGVNVGMRWALEQDVSYVWLLNNDAIVSPGSLSALVARAESDPSIGAVGSVIDEGDALVSGAHVNLWTGYARHVRGRTSETEPDYLIGASLLVRALVLHDLGLFDEGYFLYWEDADFSFRLRRAGWSLAVAVESTVEHSGHGPLVFDDPMRDFHYTRSSLRFLRRHARLPWVAAVLLTTHRLASRVFHRRWENARAILLALGHRDQPRSLTSAKRADKNAA